MSKNKSEAQIGTVGVLDRIAENGERLNKAKPFFPTLTKFFLIVGLGFLSWLATYTGMLELILANSGDLGISYRIAIAFAVAMLMLMIIYLLDSLFSPLRWWLRLLYVSGYLFLTLISVGFGFGFYWKFLESRAEATRSAESAVGQVQTALQGGQTRLEQLLVTLETLTALSTRKAELERTQGGTCPKSPPGDGPRRRLRDADAKNFKFAGDFVSQRVGSVKGDIKELNTDMAKIVSRDKSTVDPRSGTRNAYLRSINRKLDLTIARFNAFRTDPQLKQFRDNFAKRASKTVFDNGRGGTFSCPDQQLQTALRGVVKAIDGLPDLAKPAIAAVEGSEAIVEAFRRLTTSTIGLLTFNMPPSPDELRALQQKAVQSLNNSDSGGKISDVQAGLGERDYIPLFIAIFVDFCILLVSINRPVNRLQGLVAAAKEASGAQVHHVLDQFHKVHKGERSERLDIFHDLMFDNSWGDQLIAVPLDIKPDSSEQDLKKKVIKARYLSTLLVALEDTGLVSRKPLVRTTWIQKKLREIGSPYCNSESFRIYRFTKGAWSAIILDDILGESNKPDFVEKSDRQQHAIDQLFEEFDPEELSAGDNETDLNKDSFQARSEPHIAARQRPSGMVDPHSQSGNFNLNGIHNDNSEPDLTGNYGRTPEVKNARTKKYVYPKTKSESNRSSLDTQIIPDHDQDQNPPDLQESETIEDIQLAFGLEQKNVKYPSRADNKLNERIATPRKSEQNDSGDQLEAARETNSIPDIIILEPESSKKSELVSIHDDRETNTSAPFKNNGSELRYIVEDSVNTSELEGNPWISHHAGEGQDANTPLHSEETHSEIEIQDEVENQIVLFPRNATEPPPIAELNQQSSAQQSQYPALELETPARLENQIWRDSEEGGWEDNFDFTGSGDEENREYDWDQPDIQSEKIAQRFAAKNSNKIAES